MSTLEERVAYLEGQVSEQVHSLLELRDAVRNLERRIDVRFEAVDARFVAMDARFAAVDARFDAVDRRFDTVDRRIDALDDSLSRRIDSLDDKVSRQFVWMVGVQVTTLVAIVGALLARS